MARRSTSLKDFQAAQQGIQLVQDRRIIPGLTASAARRRIVSPGPACAVARALDLKLLLLDEPYEGLAPVIVKEIERIVYEIRQRGITAIIVEQNAVAALELANRALILDMGHVVFDGAAKDVSTMRNFGTSIWRSDWNEVNLPRGLHAASAFRP